MEFWNNAVIGGAIGALVSSVLFMAWNFWQRHQSRKGHATAIWEEIKICWEFAEEFRTRGVLAPAYRLPILTYLSFLSPTIGGRGPR